MSHLYYVCLLVDCLQDQATQKVKGKINYVV